MGCFSFPENVSWENVRFTETLSVSLSPKDYGVALLFVPYT